MKKVYIFSGLIFFVINTNVMAQRWTVRYNGTGNGIDAIKAMLVDMLGMYISQVPLTAVQIVMITLPLSTTRTGCDNGLRGTMVLGVAVMCLLPSSWMESGTFT